MDFSSVPHCNGYPIMYNGDMETTAPATIARYMKELQSDLADLVRSGDITAEQANEWANDKADQWAKGL